MAVGAVWCELVFAQFPDKQGIFFFTGRFSNFQILKLIKPGGLIPIPLKINREIKTENNENYVCFRELVGGENYW